MISHEDMVPSIKFIFGKRVYFIFSVAVTISWFHWCSYANTTIPQPQPIQKDHKKIIIIVVSSIVPTVLVILVILIVWGLRRNRQGINTRISVPLSTIYSSNLEKLVKSCFLMVIVWKVCPIWTHQNLKKVRTIMLKLMATSSHIYGWQR